MSNKLSELHRGPRLSVTKATAARTLLSWNQETVNSRDSPGPAMESRELQPSGEGRPPTPAPCASAGSLTRDTPGIQLLAATQPAYQSPILTTGVTLGGFSGLTGQTQDHSRLRGWPLSTTQGTPQINRRQTMPFFEVDKSFKHALHGRRTHPEAGHFISRQGKAK